MSDKRKVATDALETLGTIIDETAGRDAIHLAVEPVIAGEKLYAGDHIGIYRGKAYRATTDIKALGIVDPFLFNEIQPDQRFWFIVYPRQITSLRHVWSHPEFPEVKASVDTKSRDYVVAMAQIESYADRHGFDSAEELLVAADSWVEHGDYYSRGGDLEGEYLSDDFWDHYEIVRDRRVPRDKQQSFFTCSC